MQVISGSFFIRSNNARPPIEIRVSGTETKTRPLVDISRINILHAASISPFRWAFFATSQCIKNLTSPEIRFGVKTKGFCSKKVISPFLKIGSPIRDVIMRPTHCSLCQMNHLHTFWSLASRIKINAVPFSLSPSNDSIGVRGSFIKMESATFSGVRLNRVKSIRYRAFWKEGCLMTTMGVHPYRSRVKSRTTVRR